MARPTSMPTRGKSAESYLRLDLSVASMRADTERAPMSEPCGLQIQLAAGPRNQPVRRAHVPILAKRLALWRRAQCQFGRVWIRDQFETITAQTASKTVALHRPKGKTSRHQRTPGEICKTSTP